MDTVSFLSHSRPVCRYACTFLLVLFAIQSAVLPVAATEVPASMCSRPVLAAPPLLAGFGWQRIWGPIESALSTRQRMIQMATIGMCIGLYIMMRR